MSKRKKSRTVSRPASPASLRVGTEPALTPLVPAPDTEAGQASTSAPEPPSPEVAPAPVSAQPPDAPASSIPAPTPPAAPQRSSPPTASGLRPWVIALHAALAGATVHAGLFALSVWLHQSAEYMGVEDESVTARVTDMFADAIVAQQLGLLGLALAIGAVVGLVAGAFVDAVARHLGRSPRLRWRWLFTIATVMWLHQHMLMLSIAHYPAVYAPGAEQSSWMALSLTLAVDVLPPSLIRACFWSPIAFVVAFWLHAAFRRFYPQIRKLSHIHQVRLAGVGGLGLGLVAALGSLAARPPWSSLASHTNPARPNVLIIGVDSLRADALTPRGDKPPPAAHVAAFAAKATHFTRAIPTVPRTYPSWASMLTGLYPHHHGIRHMFPAPPAGKVIAIQHSLPTILGAAGYRTAVFSDFAGDVFTRADFGFDHVEAPEFTLPSNVALGGLKLHLHMMPWLLDVFGARTHRELLAFERLSDPEIVRDRFYGWLGDTSDPRPFMAVVFFSAGHFPFASPSPWWSRYTDPDWRGPSRFLKGHFSADLNDATPEAAHLRGLHEGAIAASDAAIGHMLEQLEAAGVLGNTIVIMTADHGESLYEHGLGTGHGDHLYGRETIEVPLIIDFPGNTRRAERIEAPVSLADLAPTVLGRLGLQSSAPAEHVAGIDLIATASDELRRRPVFGEIDLWFFPPETRRLDGKRIMAIEGFEGFDVDTETGQIFLHPSWEGMAIAAKHRMVVLDDRKLLYIPTREGVRLELYDPLSDPGDKVDLAATEPGTRDRLRAILYRWMLLDPQVEEVHGWVLPRAGALP